MGIVTGRWALVLVLCTTVPTLITHLLEGARALTVVVRTCVAAFGSLAIGLLLEWYVRQLMRQTIRQAPGKGQRLDLKVGPTDEEQASIEGAAPDDRPSGNQPAM
ncbi:MAG: hypothetical protein ACM3ZQ_09445 [Bacillota bacterium]